MLGEILRRASKLNIGYWRGTWGGRERESEGISRFFVATSGQKLEANLFYIFVNSLNIESA